MPEPTADDDGGLPDALRTAVERTFAATAGSASDTRERAGELLDEVTRRGAGAREAVEGAGRAVVRRGQGAGEAPRAFAARLLGRVRGTGSGGQDELVALRKEVETLRRRLAELEAEERGGPVKRRWRKPKAKPEA